MTKGRIFVIGDSVARGTSVEASYAGQLGEQLRARVRHGGRQRVLPEEQREVVLLRTEAGLTFAEIAATSAPRSAARIAEPVRPPVNSGNSKVAVAARG